MTKAQIAERDEYRAKLRAELPPGSIVHTVMRHRSASGMSRAIDAFHFRFEDGKLRKDWLSYWIAKATGFTFSEKYEALTVGGCGEDMGFHVVNSLGYALYPDGFECIGKDCPSNDHSNGDRNYEPHHHASGGYALRHEWI